MSVTIAHFHDPLQARIVLGRLQAEGIAATLGDEHTLLANWEWRLAVGGARLRVDEADAERARALLRAIDSGAFAIDDGDSAAHAGTTVEAATGETTSSRLAWLALMLFGIPLPWRRRARRDRRVM